MPPTQHQTQKININHKGLSFEVTGREKEILQLISLGYSSEEIARELFVSQETIRSHRKSLLQKFRARNMAQLIRLSFELGHLKI
mgnify:CR=1 FL=1